MFNQLIVNSMKAENFNVENLVGKEVQIYPGDSHRKTGIIVSVSPLGWLFKITSYSGSDKSYEVGKLHFIGVGSCLSFKVLD